MNFSLEICVDSIDSALNAIAAGASRIEICDNLAEGGTTPSYGMISCARDNLETGLHVIIRPRGGDFLYTDKEYDIMRRDIEICGECSVDGIVTGILLRNGRVDIERTARLIELANPMTVTFHRAFDLCPDPAAGLEDIISAGASRLLTSGQKNTAIEGAALIRSLVKQAGSRIIIMPGGGLNESNIEDTARITGATEFHLSGRKVTGSEMLFRRDGIALGGIPDFPEYSRKVADKEKIINIINLLKTI